MTKENFKKYFLTLCPEVIMNGLIDHDIVYQNDGNYAYRIYTDYGEVDDLITPEEWTELHKEYRKAWWNRYEINRRTN